MWKHIQVWIKGYKVAFKAHCHIMRRYSQNSNRRPSRATKWVLLPYRWEIGFSAEWGDPSKAIHNRRHSDYRT